MNKPASYLDLMKPEDISIAHCWTHFAGLVLPNAPAMQRQEMRKAFYAGFVECFKIQFDLSDLPEGETAKHLERIHKECADFYESLVKEHPPR